MPATDDTEKTIRVRRQLIGLLAASPLLALQLVYLSDIDKWNVALSYGLFGVAIGLGLVGWLVLLVIEIWRRERLLHGRFRLPCFSFGALFFLITFFLVGAWARPFVLRIPEWCRVNQVIEWETSKPNEQYGGTHSYVLVLVGRGNVSSHQFTSGYLNWTGDEAAGFSDLGLKDQTFSHWVGYNHVTIPASASALRDRVELSGISEGEADLISSEIWQAMDLAAAGKPVEVDHGTVEPVWAAPFDFEDTVLGGSVWIVVLIGSFQCIGRWSLPSTIERAEPDSGGNR